MPAFATSTTADGTGAGTVTCEHFKSGIIWVVSQVGFETIPPVGTAQVTVRFNGRYLDISPLSNAATMSGQPFQSLTASDQLTGTWAGAGAGTSLVATYYYTEYQAGYMPGSNWVV